MTTFSKSLLMGTLLAVSTAAIAEDYNRISFNSEVKSEIANDEIRASLSKTTQAATAAAIAKELNSSINHALKIAKQYPDVIVTTGQQSTYPRYDAKNKIIGFTGSVSINLKSQNFEQASQLIADLQSTLVMDDIGFGVSEKLRDSEEKRLQLEAIKRFGTEANTISQAFGASSYKIVNVNLGGSNNYYARPVMMASMKAMDAAAGIEAQNFEAGNTTLTYTANGTIELVK